MQLMETVYFQVYLLILTYMHNIDSRYDEYNVVSKSKIYNEPIYVWLFHNTVMCHPSGHSW